MKSDAACRIVSKGAKLASCFVALLLAAALFLVSLIMWQGSQALAVSGDDAAQSIIVSTEAELREALSGAASQTMVVMGQDITLTEGPLMGVNGSDPCILDLHGHTLSRNLDEPESQGCVIHIPVGCSLSIVDKDYLGGGTISGGNQYGGGGGIYNEGTLTMMGGNVVGNQCTGEGGGVLNVGVASFTNTWFESNFAGENGGAISNASNAMCSLNGGQIAANTAVSYGGGICNWPNSKVEIASALIQNNQAGQGGGIYDAGATAESGSCTLSAVTVKSNSSSRCGGGIFAETLGSSTDSSEPRLILDNATKITANTARAEGGGIYLSANYRLLMMTVKVSENQSELLGGGIYVEDGAILQMKGGPIVKENRVVTADDTSVSNVSLPQTSPIEIVGTVASSARVGITFSDVPYHTVTKDFSKNGKNEAGALADPAACFFGGENQAVFLKNGEVRVASEVPYLDERGVEKVVVDYEMVDGSFTGNTTAGMWFVVYQDTTLAERPEIKAGTHLVVFDGVTLSCNKGMDVPRSGTLNIYAQSLGEAAGTIIADARSENHHAGIGSHTGYEMGRVTINGGHIVAFGGDEAAGIGTGGNYNSDYYSLQYWESGPFVLNNGEVVAQGGNHGAGVGQGLFNCSWYRGMRVFDNVVSQMSMQVHGGKLEATGGFQSPGIGICFNNFGGFSLHVDGGEVIATGGGQASGIGGAYDVVHQTSIYVAGGNVVARGGTGKAGIGGGDGELLYSGGQTYKGDYGMRLYFLGGSVEVTSDPGTGAMGGGYEVYESEGSTYKREVYNMVLAGISADDAIIVKTDERESALRDATNSFVRVEPCDHYDFDHVDLGDGTCTGTCLLCGKELGVGYLVTLDPGLSSDSEKYAFAELGKDFTLPAADRIFAPRGQVFMGWMIGDVLYGPRDSVVIDAPTTAVAQWKTTWASLQEFFDNEAGSEEVVELVNDIVATELDGPLTIPTGKNIELRTNGYTINRNLSEPTHKGCVIRVEGELYLRGSGIVTGGNNSTSESFGGGGISVAKGAKLTMRNATVTGNVAICGAGVYTQGEFDMLSGTISGNATAADTANGNGGGVMVDGGSFTMSGTVINNTAAADGGGVMLRSGSFALVDGDIKDNAAGDSGGGVYVGGGGVMKVSGNPHVSGNVADGVTNNVLLPNPDGNPLRVEGLTNGWIGVTVWRTPREGLPVLFTSDYDGGDPSLDFFSDNPAYLVALDPSGEAMLGVAVSISFDPGVAGTHWTMDPVTWVSGSYYTLPNNYYRSANGEQFMGWGLGERIYSPGDAVMVRSDVTFTAQWTDAYRVWVGATQITKQNCSDVLGDGTVSYDPATQTLTLKDFKGTNTKGSYDSVISADGVDLTVVGSGKIAHNGTLTSRGVYVSDGSLTLAGNFDIEAEIYGIYVEGNITIAEGTIKVEVHHSAGRGITSYKSGCTTTIKHGIDSVEVISPKQAFRAINGSPTAVLEAGLYVKEPQDGSLTAPHVIIERIPDYVPPEDEPLVEPAFRTHSLLLDGTIGVVFYMELPDIEGVDWSESYMEFSVAGKDGATVTDTFDANDTNDAGTYYGFTCYVSSIQMADVITATLHYGDGKTVSQTYSVAEYVETFDARLAENPGAFDETTVNLVHALADYGHYAQAYLSRLRGWTIGSDHAEMAANADVTSDMADDARAGLEDFAPIADIPAASDVRAISMDLDLESDTTICVYVALKEGAKLVSATLADGSELQAEKMGDGRWGIMLPGIMAHRLTERFDITITTSGGTVARVNVAAVFFARVVLNADSFKDNAEAQNLATALWRYSQAAQSYRQAHPST